jgi:hypothetical protein
MISECMKNNSGFGVCLIKEGAEVGKAATSFDMGTLGEISYFQKLKDGCLGITVRGVQRFRVIDTSVQPNQLTMATVELLANEPEKELPELYNKAVELLQEIIEQLGQPYTNMQKNFEDASWVSGRLAELLPLSLQMKQELLQLDDPLKRLACITELLEEMKIS